MLPGRSNKSFILSLTLTEVLILLFFVLLFAAVWEISTANETIDEQLEQIAEASGINKKQAISLIEAMQKRDESQELRERLQEAEKRIEGYDSLLAMQEEMEDDDFRELVRRAAKSVNSEKEVTRLRSKLDSTEETLEAMKNKAANMKAQVTNMSARLRNAGMGFPPCWADSLSGKPEYIYSVELRQDSLQVERSWPEYREDEARKVNGALRLAGSSVSRQEFSQLAQPVLNWSKSQDPECRHFVIIEDTPATTKDQFKESMLLVENYFYKFLPRG